MVSPFFKIIQGLIVFLFIVSAWSAAAAAPPPSAGRIIVIDKAKRSLTLLVDGTPRFEFPASFGIDPDSDKFKALDCATPEGLHHITDKAASHRFHRLLAISHPNLAKAQRALAKGVISGAQYRQIFQAHRKSQRPPANTGLGSDIAIHGGGVFRMIGKSRERDWTEGCIALNDQDMETLFHLCHPGDPVLIFNSRRNLYGIIRPFAHIPESDQLGMPVCADGVYTCQVEITTTLGLVNIVIREGKGHGQSMQVTVHDLDRQKEPLLVLDDRNADGHLSPLDSGSGPILDGKTPDAAYALVREAVIAALAQGARLR